MHPTPTKAALARLPQLRERAHMLLQLVEPTDSYYGCFSGGKDSVVIKHLAAQAKVKVDWHFHQTGIEPFESVWFIKTEHPDVVRHKPRESFFNLAKHLGFPTRRYRWCCRHLKENRCPRRGRILLGVRADESPRRAEQWQHVAWHEHERLWAICPILEWTGDDVWAYIEHHGLAYCSLYDEGFNRIGCVGCPLASAKDRRQQFERWPNIAKHFRSLMQYLWEARYEQVKDAQTLWAGQTKWQSPQEMFDWYVDNNTPGTEPCGAGERMLAD